MQQFYAWGNASFWLQNNILQRGWGELRTSGASSPIFGGHTMTFSCSGLHAHCSLLQNQNSIVPKITCQNCPALYTFL